MSIYVGSFFVFFGFWVGARVLQLGIAYEPGPRVFTKQQKYEELLKKISSAFTDQVLIASKHSDLRTFHVF
jgi:hypothetical protein